MSETTRKPITGELRARMIKYSTYESLGSSVGGVPHVKLGAREFGVLCDAIDSVHAALEEENEALRAELEACRPDSWEAIIRDAYLTGSRGEVIVVEPFEERCRALARGER